MPLLDLRRAREEVTLTEVLGLIGWHPVEQKGQQARGGCPIHGSSTGSRSFSAHLGHNCWQCFKCGAKGNALDLWAQVHCMPLYSATCELYKRLGRLPPLRYWRPAEQ